jgi:hypothetical protein
MSELAATVTEQISGIVADVIQVKDRVDDSKVLMRHILQYHAGDFGFAASYQS